MLGNVILPPLTSGESESTCRTITSGDSADAAAWSGGDGPVVLVFEDAITSNMTGGLADDAGGWKRRRRGRLRELRVGLGFQQTALELVRAGLEMTKKATARWLRSWGGC